jgi:hypothetical protein
MVILPARTELWGKVFAAPASAKNAANNNMMKMNGLCLRPDAMRKYRMNTAVCILG